MPLPLDVRLWGFQRVGPPSFPLALLRADLRDHPEETTREPAVGEAIGDKVAATEYTVAKSRCGGEEGQV